MQKKSLKTFQCNVMSKRERGEESEEKEEEILSKKREGRGEKRKR